MIFPNLLEQEAVSNVIDNKNRTILFIQVGKISVLPAIYKLGFGFERPGS
jgi:hypothetical protein